MFLSAARDLGRRGLGEPVGQSSPDFSKEPGSAHATTYAREAVTTKK